MEEEDKLYQLAKLKGLIKKDSLLFEAAKLQNKEEKIPNKLTGLTVELVKVLYSTQASKSGGKKNDKRTL